MPPTVGLPFEDLARKYVAARYSLVLVQTGEEERLAGVIQDLAKRAFSQPVPCFSWSVTRGLILAGGEPVNGTESAAAALEAVIAYPRPALFLFFDLHRFYDDARVVRLLREAEQALSPTYKTIFLCSPTDEIPPECRKDIAVLDLPLPGTADLSQIFDEACAAARGLTLELGDQREALIRGTLGLTAQEARRAFTKALLGKRTAGPELVELLYEEKRQLVRKEGILDYIPPRVQLESIGGLASLKRWLTQRRRFFTGEADAFGLDAPKGLLVTGISGCGKSMAVQAISSYWKLPMLRLDMNRIYSAMAGTPERTLERAIRSAEAVAPCVLWIDEIETALVGTHGSSGGNISTRIFSSFLTWMQEKQQLVFVAATANEIDKLPPELLRKGRFDQIFFVDLPNESERQEIVAVHLAKRGKDPAAFDLLSLAKSTGGFNAAELEQLLLTAMFNAFDQGRQLEMTDLYRSLNQMVPLSTTMAERIKEIKRWADTRAIKAS